MLITLVIIAIIIALLFDVMNGFHDSANSIATVVSTRVLTPKVAVLWAAFFNLVPMFIFAPRVADTISKIVKIESHDYTFFYVICSGLVGAIIWDLITWWWKLPTSSSHALIGGLSGAGFAFGGLSALRWPLLIKTFEFIVIAPLMGFALGFIIILSMYWIFQKQNPASIDKGFRKAQLVSAALYSIGHGANDAQKTMGVIMALLIGAGMISTEETLSLTNPKTFWIILSCQLAMSLGTALGGWRIVQTMGMKIAKLKPIGGFSAETAGAITLFFATHFGIPVSTTHTITGAIIGISSAIYRPSHIKWTVASKILWAWLFTIPGSALIAAVTFYLFSFFFLNGT